MIRRGAHRRVAGDPEHPVSRGSLCTKCSIAYNGIYQDKAARLTQPLRRVGAKGEGRFEPIGWDEALATVADRFKAIMRQSGPDKIFNAHYTGARSLLARDFPMRFFNRLGSTEVVPETICNIAGQIALNMCTALPSPGSIREPRGRIASWSGGQIPRQRRHTRIGTGCRSPAPKSSSSTRSATRPRKWPICTFNPIRVPTRRLLLPCSISCSATAFATRHLSKTMSWGGKRWSP